MNWIRENLIENPMLTEISRMARVLRGRTAGAFGAWAVILFALLLSGILCLYVSYSFGGASPSGPIYWQLAFCCIAIPLRFYSSIAGERERRSWELLRVAPVTNTQITIGKFSAAAATVVLIHVIFLLPIVMATLSVDTNPYSWTSYSPYGSSIERVDTLALMGKVALADLLSLVVGLLVAALTLFLSARCRRSFAALGLILGALGTYFFLLPTVSWMLLQDTFLASFFNPFVVIGDLAQGYTAPWDEAPEIGSLSVIASFITNGALVAVFVGYAAKTLTFADDMIRFMPRKKA